ncbi:MAG: ComEC/Rec2 family competence protein [Patescibacteria group bacterium]
MKFQSISFIFLILLILLRFYSSRPVYKNGNFVKITSKVYSEPIIYDTKQYLKIQGLKVYLPKYPEIVYGDKIEIRGQVIGDRLVNPELIEIQDSRFKIYDLRSKIIDFYKQSLPEPYSSLVSGIVIGSKNMPESFWEKLKQTGTAHVVVASGTNVTMTIGFLIGILTNFLKRRTAIWITLVGILGYVTISGFDAPIVRAGIMGSILLLGQSGGKVANTWRILIYSGILMLLIKPVWISDLGFILSFVATTSILIFQKRIDNYLKVIPNLLREGLSTSLAAQIGVAPIIFITFGQFNILSPIINALVLWTIPYIMVIGALGGIVGLIVPLVGRLMLFILFPLLWYFTKIISIF